MDPCNMQLACCAIVPGRPQCANARGVHGMVHGRRMTVVQLAPMVQTSGDAEQRGHEQRPGPDTVGVHHISEDHRRDELSTAIHQYMRCQRLQW